MTNPTQADLDTLSPFLLIPYDRRYRTRPSLHPLVFQLDRQLLSGLILPLSGYPPRLLPVLDDQEPRTSDQDPDQERLNGIGIGLTSPHLRLADTPVDVPLPLHHHLQLPRIDEQ